MGVYLFTINYGKVFLEKLFEELKYQQKQRNHVLTLNVILESVYMNVLENQQKRCFVVREATKTAKCCFCWAGLALPSINLFILSEDRKTLGNSKKEPLTPVGATI